MRISFDIDGTLVCAPPVPTEQFVRWLGRWRYREPLRRGTKALMTELIRGDHEVWIYSTSHRTPRYIRGWFRSFGVTLSGVVNQEQHDSVVGRQGPSKYPPAFGIDLHIDDSPGVGEEGQRHRFDVVVVSPQAAVDAAEETCQPIHKYPQLGAAARTDSGQALEYSRSGASIRAPVQEAR